jgi:hypothetical protein
MGPARIVRTKTSVGLRLYDLALEKPKLARTGQNKITGFAQTYIGHKPEVSGRGRNCRYRNFGNRFTMIGGVYF